MTPSENFRNFFLRKPYEWVPSSADMLKIAPAMIPDNVARAFVNQQHPYEGEFGGFDMFGIEWVYEPLARGSMDVNPPYEELEEWEEKLKWPDLNAFDWEGCARENEDYLKTDKIIFSVIYTGYFERLISFVGFENAALALIDEDQEDTVRKLFDKLTDFYIEYVEKMHSYFGLEYVTIHDDWGNQKSTMFSLETHLELIVPYITRFVSACHRMGVFVEMHSCGRIETMIPNLISTGMDTWMGQAINDKKKLVEEFGNQFMFAIDVRQENVSDEEAIAYMKELLDEYNGKRVWYCVGRSYKPSQLEKIYSMIRNEAVVAQV